MVIANRAVDTATAKAILTPGEARGRGTQSLTGYRVPQRSSRTVTKAQGRIHCRSTSEKAA